MGFGSIFNRKKKQNPMSNTPGPDSMASPPVPFDHSSSLESPIQTRTQLQELEQVFNKLDVNGDGKISSSELCSIMGSLGHSKEELQMMIDDDDGFMNFKQFVELNMKGVESEEVLESLREAFSVYDRDGNGWIPAEELQAVLRSLGDECVVISSNNTLKSNAQDKFH
ncbi:hypothetical protein HRI_002691200 [Hibiscus trionum]|uniref:EF-hand domain-containing protein n=1 Tax=Hibiscus trionum TaxID=183268 RepID=A0A9W7I6D8_HIBTR|nr:hypothetical protein HRI_002691200 [Hibiscus trionum]